MDMPTKAGLYNVWLKRTSPHAREFLDIKAWFSPKTGVWISEDMTQVMGTSRGITARCNGVTGWALWRFQEIE